MGFFDRFRLLIDKANLIPKVEHDVLKNEDVVDPLVKLMQLGYHDVYDPLPKSQSEMYKKFGRPEKERDKHQSYRKAKMTIADHLPGSWNKRQRLFMLEALEQRLREALDRLEKLGKLGYIMKMGCYNFRHMRYDKGMPLSIHSWGAAVDINPDDNGAHYTKKTHVPPPFSKEWRRVYTNGVPLELVVAFFSVGMRWGGDWNHSKWLAQALDEGEGYEPSRSTLDDWKHVSFVDPMHFELIKGTAGNQYV